jgi:hypothetical protein
MTTTYWLFHYLTSSCYCSAGTDLLFMKELKWRNSKLPKLTKTQDSDNAGFSNNRPKYLSLRSCMSCHRCSETRLEIFTTFFFSSIWVNPRSNIVNATSPLLPAQMYSVLEKVYSDILCHFVLQKFCKVINIDLANTWLESP